MANEQNLKPLNKRTKSEQRKIAKKGRKSKCESKKKKEIHKRAVGTAYAVRSKRFSINK